MDFTVLIIDDSKLARITARTLVSSLHPGWKLLEAGNAVEALQAIRTHQPQIVLADNNMPERAGLDIVKDIRAISPLTEIAIVSANIQQGTIERAHSLGVSFLAKPLETQALDAFLDITARAFALGVVEDGADNTDSLSELELDALTEIANISISKAAASLAELVREEILLSVPRAEMMPREAAVAWLTAHTKGPLVAVHQLFDGDIKGTTLLIFPEANSLELVRGVVGNSLSYDEIIEMESEALCEIGNVILNACLATIANLLHRTLKTSLPEVLHGDANTLVNTGTANVRILFIYIDFSIASRDVRGYLAVILDMPAVTTLKRLLRHFIARNTA